MKIYILDYSKTSEALVFLNNAQLFLSQDRYGLAENAIVKARDLIQDFIRTDHMVEDPNVCGWVRLSDHLDMLNMIKKDGEPGLKS